MPDTSHLLMFMLAGLLLNLTPGPDVFYIMGHSMRAGRRAGLVASAGVLTGCLVHVLLAAAGLSALVAASPLVFSVLKGLGAAYLVYIGVGMLRTLWHPVPEDEAGQGAAWSSGNRVSLSRIYRQGFLSDVLNPKTALFFLAFLPQFVTPGTAHPGLALLLLGLLFTFNSAIFCALWAVLTARLGATRTLRRAMHWFEGLAGAVIILFGLRVAFADAPATH